MRGPRVRDGTRILKGTYIILSWSGSGYHTTWCWTEEQHRVLEGQTVRQ